VASGTPWYRRAVAVYDRSYRRLHGLDRPTARVGPVLSVQRRWMWRALRLADGTVLRRGARIGVLHLDNGRALALHGSGLDPGQIGFEFRRLVLSSLRALATQAVDGGPLAQLQAYSVTTLFHHRLPRLGFAPAPGDPSIGRQLVSRYERALLSSLHPAGRARLRRGDRDEARRLWISRQALLARFGRIPGEQPCTPVHD
jgi:YkoP-like protein